MQRYRAHVRGKLAGTVRVALALRKRYGWCRSVRLGGHGGWASVTPVLGQRITAFLPSRA